MDAHPNRRFAALAGLLATAGALASGELIAGAVGSWRSPVESVGLSIIDLVPGPVERWAISTLGTADKPVLVGSTIVMTLLFGALLGLLARRSFPAAAAGVVALGGLALAATVFQADVAAGVPSILTAVIGVPLLAFMVGRAPREQVAPASGASAEAPSGADGSSTPVGAGSADRRSFLALSGGVAVASAVAVVGGRALTARQTRAIQGARDEITAQIGATDGVGSASERALGVVDAPLGPIPPGADFEIDGLAPFVTPAEDFYRIDSALTVPQVDPGSWSLRIHGMVDQEVEHTYEELLRREDLFEADITLTCVSNEVGGSLMSSARWTGIPLGNLLDEAGVQDGVTQVVGRSIDDWTGGFPVEDVYDGRNAMVALLMNGEPLSADRGFPARILMPGLYGYVSATKWLTEIELTTFEDFTMYWVERGWEDIAPIKTQSRIDVPKPLQRVPAGEIQVAGVAWAQQRGIEKVEIRVDEGEWQEVELAEEVNIDTWRQWRWTWTGAEPGSHRLNVRATDKTGATQTEERQPPFPDGATGWMTLLVTVTDGEA